MATNYQRGYAAEQKLRKEMEERGFTVVRSGGSKGPIDLAAFNGTELLLLQVKSAQGKKRTAEDYIRAGDANALIALPVGRTLRVHKILAVCHRGQKEFSLLPADPTGTSPAVIPAIVPTEAESE